MLTAIVLTHNDESVISKTLESIIFCDEVIIIDDFSTDKTLETVHKVYKHLTFVTYKIFQRKLLNDFAKQRNFGLQKAGGDWVLFIDSDEVVTQQLAYEIKQVVEIPNLKSQISIDGYHIKRSDFLFGKWLRFGETASITLLRLAKKNTGSWRRPVHEVWDINGQTGMLKHPLLHYPHPNVAQFIDDINVYSSLNALYLYTIKAPFRTWHIIAYPKAKFFLNYVIRLGFLDGMQGFIHALFMSFHSFLTRGKLWSLYHKQQRIV